MTMTVRPFLMLCAGLLLTACATPDPMTSVQPLLAAGDIDGAIAQLQADVERNPLKSPARVAYHRLPIERKAEA